MKEYYLMIDGKKKVPFSIEEVRQLPLFDTDLIWTKGMSDWISVVELKELQENFYSKTCSTSCAARYKLKDKLNENNSN